MLLERYESLKGIISQWVCQKKGWEDYVQHVQDRDFLVLVKVMKASKSINKCGCDAVVTTVPLTELEKKPFPHLDGKMQIFKPIATTKYLQDTTGKLSAYRARSRS